MIVAIASGSNPLFNVNPLKSVQTLTTYMANVSMGDVSFDSIEYKTIFCLWSCIVFNYINFKYYSS